MEFLNPQREVSLASLQSSLILSVFSPVAILFKISCQQLCKDKVGWDEPLLGNLLERLILLLSMLKKAEAITIPRCVFHDMTQLTSIQLIGICDASTKVYAA